MNFKSLQRIWEPTPGAAASVKGSPGLEDPQAAEIEMLAIEMQEGGVSITFLQTAGVRYLLETTTDLQQLDWSILQTIPVVDQDKNTSIVDANHMEPQRFYRLRGSTLRSHGSQGRQALGPFGLA